MYFGWMDRNPGSPPTPMEFAITPALTDTMAAMAEPIIAARKG